MCDCGPSVQRAERLNKLLKVRIRVAALNLVFETPGIPLQLVSFKCGSIDSKHKNCRVIRGIDVGRCALKPLRNFSNWSLLNSGVCLLIIYGKCECISLSMQHHASGKAGSHISHKSYPQNGFLFLPFRCKRKVYLVNQSGTSNKMIMVMKLFEKIILNYFSKSLFEVTSYNWLTAHKRSQFTHLNMDS